MRGRRSLCAAGCLLTLLAWVARPVQAIDLLGCSEGELDLDSDQANPGTRLADADGDGVPDLVLNVHGFSHPDYRRVFRAVKLDGTVLWDWRAIGVCDSCVARFEAYPVGFADVDPSPGKEAIVSWFGYITPPFDDYRFGVVVVSNPGGAILARFPNLFFEALLDLNGDGRDDLVLGRYDDTRPITEVWGIGTPATCALTAVEPVPGPGGERLRAVPNPAPGRVSFIDDASLSGARVVRLYDVRGRLVRVLARSGPGAAFEWDGRDSRGRPLPAGTYYAETQGGRDSRRATVVIVR